MNDLQIFNSKEFGEVRTVLVDNEPMFCLVDICRALDISNPSKVAQRAWSITILLKCHIEQVR